MTPSRREVRVRQSFFEQLDLLLPPKRGPNGEPSAHDFLTYDLPDVLDAFATGFSLLPMVIDGFPAARMAIGSGLVTRAFAVFAVETEDGSVEVIGLTIDP